MEYQSKIQENWHAVVTVTVDAEKVGPQLADSLASLSKRVKLEGFRKGKVPRGLIKKMFGKQIEEQVYEPYYRQALDELFKADGYDPISMPKVENVQFDDKKGLTFDVTFDVRPDFQVEDLKGAEIEKTEYTVDKKDVENALESLRQQQAMIHTVEGEAQPGHYVVADIQELDSTGLPIIGRKYEKQSLYVRPDDQELTPQLLGVKPGEIRRIRLAVEKEKSPTIDTLESDNKETEKRFELSVREIKERRVPELDDEFAKDLGDYKNLGELKKRIQENLKNNAESDSNHFFRQALMDEAIKRNTVQVPPSMLSRYLDSVVQDAKKREPKVDEKQLYEHARAGAIRTIKWILIRQRLVEKAGIEVTDDQVRAHLQQAVVAGGLKEDQAKGIEENKERFESIKDELIDTALFEWLAGQCKVKTTKKPWRSEEEEADPVTAT
ncbi:trigger factor [candidate division KSB1 bacterium]|nr:trigger factor [candidate division KSB1 bacterium]